MMKRVLILGDGFLQVTIIKAAKNLGCYVIGCDMKSGNPGESLLDEFYNVSTTDCKKILQLAKNLNIDGILTYASDVSAMTVAYVAQELGLPCNPISTVNVMSHKELFHPFLQKHQFKVPKAVTIRNVKELFDFFDVTDQNIMVKPNSSSGSKGVVHVTDRKMLEEAYNEAKKYTKDGDVIIAEEFIQRVGYQIAGDAFIVNGKIAFWGLADEHFDDLCNPLVPIGESFPSTITDDFRLKARSEIERALSVLGYQNGAVNLDFMFDKNGDVIILELGPRNGGNLITDAIYLSCGVDLAEYTVKAALGEDLSDLKDKKMIRNISSYVWHSSQNGIFRNIKILPELQKRVRMNKLFIKSGDRVEKYNNGSFAMGDALLEFDDVNQMNYMMDHMGEYYSINLE